MLHMLRNNYVLSKVITFLIIFAVILGITLIVYSQPEPTPTYPNTPFVAYYFRVNYSTQSNGTATVTGLDTPMIWFAGYNAPEVVIEEQNLTGFTQYSTENLVTLESNTTEHFLWWIPPWLPTGTPVNMSSDTGVIVGQTEITVQGLVRNTIVVFYSGSDRTIIANYEANSGFLVQLEIKEGGQMSIYQLESILGASLGVSNYYYARVIFLILFIPSLVMFLLMLPWPWRKWSRSLLKTLRQEI
ncbi:MAG: hypothetical protein WED07_09745 [Candidatus Freyarchaeum deiterrae]